MLFYREALRQEHAARADRITDTSAAMWDAEGSQELVRKLRG